MDVTPELIETIDFPEKFRGYDPEEVNKFLERVGGRIVELSDSLAAANRRADEEKIRADDIQRTADEAQRNAVPASMTEEQEAAEAAKTLMLARRTADALIADARIEAGEAVDTARTEAVEATESARAEAEQLRSDAQSRSDEIIEEARTRAESEFADQRAEIASGLDDLRDRKQNALADVEALEQRVAEYREALQSVSSRLTEVLADPDLLRERVPLDIDETPVESVFETTGHEADAPAAEPTVEPAPPAVDEPPVPATGLPTRDPGAVGDAAWGQGSSFGPPAATAGSRVHAQNAPDAGEVAAAADPEAEAASDAGAIPFPPTSVSPAGAPSADSPAETSGGDPWVPGSWSAVMDPSPDAPPPPSAEDTVGGQPASGAPSSGGTTFSPAEQFDATADTPTVAVADDPAEQQFQVVEMGAEPVTGSFGGLSQDRYLRDLDQAVNSDEPDDADDAMSAFLLGDDEAQSRRFGRRR